jgi:hypothetical protein
MPVTVIKSEQQYKDIVRSFNPARTRARLTGSRADRRQGPLGHLLPRAVGGELVSCSPRRLYCRARANFLTTPGSKGIAPKFKEYAENPRWKDFKFYRVDICEQQVRSSMLQSHLNSRAHDAFRRTSP